MKYAFSILLVLVSCVAALGQPTQAQIDKKNEAFEACSGAASDQTNAQCEQQDAYYQRQEAANERSAAINDPGGYNLQIWLQGSAKYDDGQEFLDSGDTILNEGDGHKDLADLAQQLGDEQWGMGNWSAACEYYNEAITKSASAGISYAISEGLYNNADTKFDEAWDFFYACH